MKQPGNLMYVFLVDIENRTKIMGKNLELETKPALEIVWGKKITKY